MGLLGFLLVLLCSVPLSLAQETIDATILVKGGTIIAETDDNFVCATLDWWPPEKCNYNQCPWGHASVLNLDLKNPLFAKAIRAFNPLRIRIGGSLQDRVVYDVGNLGSPCIPFKKTAGELFGFSKGCLPMGRWDELNRLFHETGAIVTFGLNALHGRHGVKKGVWKGAWNSTNAHDFIEYTISKGYQIDSWEFGNELSGSGVGASVDAKQYGEDVIGLKALLQDLYQNLPSEPLLLAPGGYFDEHWFTQLLQTSGSSVVNVITHHIYNLGAGVDPNLKSKILNPSYLSQIAQTFRNLKFTLQNFGPWTSSWVGESGGAYNSGGRHISNTFLNSFWYLDQLGMASMYNTKAYCRQTLIGGNYGLLDTSTFVPNPDYYSALLWHRLMGKRVLTIDFSGSPYLRTYAHCSKNKAGVTLLLINLSNSTAFNVMIQNELLNITLRVSEKIQREGSFVHGLKKTVSWVGRKASDVGPQREEYHLTPKDGYLQSQTMLLNGRPLELTDSGDIPALRPVLVDLNSPVSIAPLSIAFASFPYFDVLACS